MKIILLKIILILLFTGCKSGNPVQLHIVGSDVLLCDLTDQYNASQYETIVHYDYISSQNDLNSTFFKDYDIFAVSSLINDSKIEKYSYSIPIQSIQVDENFTALQEILAVYKNRLVPYSIDLPVITVSESMIPAGDQELINQDTLLSRLKSELNNKRSLYSIYYSQLNAADFFSFLNLQGTNLQTRNQFNDNQIKQYCNWYNSLSPDDSSKSIFQKPVSVINENSDTLQLLKSGLIPFDFMSASQAIPLGRTGRFRILYPDTTMTSLYFKSLIISRYSAKKEKAIQFINHVISNQAQSELFELSEEQTFINQIHIPVNRKILEKSYPVLEKLLIHSHYPAFSDIKQRNNFILVMTDLSNQLKSGKSIDNELISSIIHNLNNP